MKIWIAETNQINSQAGEGHSYEINAVAFSPNGLHVATGSNDQTAIIWDAKSGKLSHTLHHDNIVWAVAFSPDS